MDSNLNAWPLCSRNQHKMLVIGYIDQCYKNTLKIKTFEVLQNSNTKCTLECLENVLPVSYMFFGKKMITIIKTLKQKVFLKQ